VAFIVPNKTLVLLWILCLISCNLGDETSNHVETTNRGIDRSGGSLARSAGFDFKGPSIVWLSTASTYQEESMYVDIGATSYYAKIAVRSFRDSLTLYPVVNVFEVTLSRHRLNGFPVYKQFLRLAHDSSQNDFLAQLHVNVHTDSSAKIEAVCKRHRQVKQLTSTAASSYSANDTIQDTLHCSDNVTRSVTVVQGLTDDMDLFFVLVTVDLDDKQSANYRFMYDKKGVVRSVRYMNKNKKDNQLTEPSIVFQS